MSEEIGWKRVEDFLTSKSQTLRETDESAFIEKMRELIALEKKSANNTKMMIRILELLLKQRTYAILTPW